MEDREENRMSNGLTQIIGTSSKQTSILSAQRTAHNSSDLLGIENRSNQVGDEQMVDIMKQNTQKSMKNLHPIFVKTLKKKEMIQKLEKAISEGKSPVQLKIYIETMVSSNYQDQEDNHMNDSIRKCQEEKMKKLI